MRSPQERELRPVGQADLGSQGRAGDWSWA